MTVQITYTNASFCELVGISADHLIKMRLHEVRLGGSLLRLKCTVEFKSVL